MPDAGERPKMALVTGASLGVGRYRTSLDLRIRLTLAISCADLADFLLYEAVVSDYPRQFPRIAA